jgi:malonate transporter
MPSVFSSLIPVVTLIAVGLFAGRRGWVTAAGAKELTDLSFLVLAPALLFRTMSQVRWHEINMAPVALYFVAAMVLFAIVIASLGASRRSAVMALAATFSNTVMIGIPLVTLAYGPSGLVYLFTLISMHALILLTLATVVLELVMAREAAHAMGGEGRHPLKTIGLAVRNAVIHPVPLPILAGLLWGQTGWVMPEVLDKPIQWLGATFGPLALLMVGITLSNVLDRVIRAGGPADPQFSRQRILWSALGMACLKNLVHPSLVVGMSLLLGLRGLPVAVMMVASSLPIGANVFLFSQRYKVAEDEVTSAVAVSTLAALLTVPIVMAGVVWVM